MSVRKLKVVLTRKLPEPVETRMRELFDAELNLDDRAFGEQELKDAMGRAEVLCCTITDNITADIIAAKGERPNAGIDQESHFRRDRSAL